MRDNLTNYLIILIILSSSLIFINVLRLNNTEVMPYYDQYEFINANFFTSNIYFPFIFGLINISLLFLLLKKTIKKKNQVFYTLIITTLSPVFLYVHSTQNNLYYSLTFILIAILFLLRHLYLLSTLFLILTFYFNPEMFFIVFLVLIYSFEKIKGHNIKFPIIGILATTFIFVSINNFIPLTDLLNKYVFDFGAELGFSIFMLILSFIGLIISWNNKKKNVLNYTILLSLVFASFFDIQIILFIDLVLAYFGGIGLLYLTKRKWDVDLFKNYVIILLICGLIFSAGSYAKRHSINQPTEKEILSLEWLSNYQGNVLSHYEHGFMIKQISGLKTYTDKKYFLESKNKVKINQSNEIFLSRDLKKVFSFFNKNNIKYVWINTDMKTGKIWNKKDEGMLLLLRTSKNFTKIYDNEIEIWQYN